MNQLTWSRRGGMVLISIAVLSAAALGGAAERRKVENPHVRKDAKGCLFCHVSIPKGTAITRKDYGLRFGGDVVALCGDCHAGYKHMHPVRIAVAPDMKSPEDLPLDREGKITCITCHDVMHIKGVHMKQKLTGRQLCLNCHADSDILAQVVWYPTHLRKGENGRLEIKVVEFRVLGKKVYLGDSVLLYYYSKNVDTGEITFGTNVLYDDGTHGDRVAHDSVYSLTEEADNTGKKKRVVYTGWVLDANARRSNTVTLAVEYD